MRTQNLLIVALASSCCVASAQVIVNQPAPPPVSHPAPAAVSHSSSTSGGTTYHGSGTQSGGTFGSSNYHGYQNGNSNSASGHYSGTGSLQGASLQPGGLSGRSGNWHDNFGSHEPFGSHESFGWHEGDRGHDGFGNHENRFENRFDHGVGWHQDEFRHDGKAPEWNRREEERSHEANRWEREEHGAIFHHEGWWPGHDFEGRFADRGKEYFGDLARMAERWTGKNEEKNVSTWGLHNGYAIDNGWWSKGTSLRNYWDYVPTYAWLRERASFFQERIWDWNWWR